MPEHPIEAGEKRLANLTGLQRELAEMAAQASGRLSVTIRPCRLVDFDTIHAIVNDAAEAYRVVIPADCWKVPYMSREELRHEIAEGVVYGVRNGCAPRPGQKVTAPRNQPVAFEGCATVAHPDAEGPILSMR